MKDYQTLVGLLAVALAIYLGLSKQNGDIVNMKSELQTCIDITEEYTNSSGFDAWKICISAYGND